MQVNGHSLPAGCLAGVLVDAEESAVHSRYHMMTVAAAVAAGVLDNTVAAHQEVAAWEDTAAGFAGGLAGVAAAAEESTA